MAFTIEADVRVNPVTPYTSNTLNASNVLRTGNTIIVADVAADLLTLITAPTLITENKELWIKNVRTSALEIETSVGTIDGLTSIVLSGPVAGVKGGDCVHLAWSQQLTMWLVLNQYTA